MPKYIAVFIQNAMDWVGEVKNRASWFVSKSVASNLTYVRLEPRREETEKQFEEIMDI